MKRSAMTLTRRDSILLASAGLVASPEDDLARLFADRRSAAAIGRAWLAEHGSAPDADLSSLRQAVLTALADHGREPLRSRFQDRVRRDFAEGNVVMVEGWMLSSVEALVCAIAWLSTDDYRQIPRS